MSRRPRYNSDTLWRLHAIGGADLALRYVELSEQSRADADTRQLGTPAASPPSARSVVVNGARLPDRAVEAMERTLGVSIRDGAYWYDTACGAWGVEGGPCEGFIQAGLPLGGPLRRDASKGDTGVFINGRELHVLDVMALRRLGPVFPGRYWIDARGNFGVEGGPTLGNLALAARMAGANAPWTANSRFGTAGGDGSGFLFFNDGKTFWST